MATVYSVEKTLWDQNVPKENVNPRDLAGRVRIAYATYETTTSDTAGTVIEMFNLPNGARILHGYLAYDDLNTSTTLSVGHAAYTSSAGATVALDVDEYYAAAAATTAAKVDIANTLALGAFTVVDADETGIPITVVTAGATQSAADTISLTMLYVVD